MMINSFRHYCIDSGIRIEVCTLDYDLQEIQNLHRNTSKNVDITDIFDKL